MDKIKIQRLTLKYFEENTPLECFPVRDGYYQKSCVMIVLQYEFDIFTVLQPGIVIYYLFINYKLFLQTLLTSDCCYKLNLINI